MLQSFRRPQIWKKNLVLTCAHTTYAPKYGWLECSTRDQLLGAKRGLCKITGIVFIAVKMQIISTTKIWLSFGQNHFWLKTVISTPKMDKNICSLTAAKNYNNNFSDTPLLILLIIKGIHCTFQSALCSMYFKNFWYVFHNFYSIFS